MGLFTGLFASCDMATLSVDICMIRSAQALVGSQSELP